MGELNKIEFLTDAISIHSSSSSSSSRELYKYKDIVIHAIQETDVNTNQSVIYFQVKSQEGNEDNYSEYQFKTLHGSNIYQIWNEYSAKVIDDEDDVDVDYEEEEEEQHIQQHFHIPEPNTNH